MTGAKKAAANTADQPIDHLILGGGAAAVSAAIALRLEDPSATITLLCADEGLPFYRPALSKQALLGTADEAQILIHPASFYAEQNIRLELGTTAIALDTEARVVSCASGARFSYRRLLIATGAKACRLALPGADLPGIHHLRDRAECAAMRREIAAGARRAIVLGGSFLGMEIAMSLRDLGLEVTVIEQREQVLPHVESGRVSDFFRRHAEERGLKVLLCDTITALHGVGRLSETPGRNSISAAGFCPPSAPATAWLSAPCRSWMVRGTGQPRAAR